jgi:CHAT domain-containing protein
VQSEWRYVTQIARGESSTFRDIKSTLEDDRSVAQVEFAVTDRGTVAYLTQGRESCEASNGLPDLRGDADLHLFTLPKVTFSELQRRLWIGPDSWFGSLRNYRQPSIRKFRESMDRILPWLHSELMMPLIPHLKNMNSRKLRIIPHRALHLIPFAALSSGDAEGNHHYIIDDFEVEYAPSATLRRICSERQQEPASSQSVTIVTDPASNLRFAGFEAEQVAEAFNRGRVQRARNRAELQEAASQGLGSVFHFSGHGLYRWDDPMKSSLSLGAGESLTLEDLFSQEIEFPQTNLVVLAACETTVVDPRDQADEYLGLASGFMFGGTRTVISTLWPVDDLSTALLMKEFYRLHLSDGHPIGSALRLAQKWLRDSTAEEMKVVEYWQQSYDASGQRDAESFRALRMYRSNPGFQPFRHPYYWAGFTCSGAS